MNRRPECFCVLAFVGMLMCFGIGLVLAVVSWCLQQLVNGLVWATDHLRVWAGRCEEVAR